MSQIKADEVVLFFPTAATSRVPTANPGPFPIHGCIFEPEENDLLRGKILRELATNLGTICGSQEQPPCSKSGCDCSSWTTSEANESRVRIAGSEYTLPPSAPDGHFIGTIQLPAATVQAHLDAGRLPFQAILRPGDSRDFSGVAYCLPPTGVSVISDIDDTIKVSNVRNRKSCCRTHSLREFRAVDGMAAAYQKLGRSRRGVPLCLGQPLATLPPARSSSLASAGFPAGIFHFKRVRLKDAEPPRAIRRSARLQSWQRSSRLHRELSSAHVHSRRRLRRERSGSLWRAMRQHFRIRFVASLHPRRDK